MNQPQFFWIDPNKFDCCRHRIVSVSMMENLRKMGLPVTYVTAYVREAVPYAGFHYVEPWTKTRGLYRIAFLAACLRFLASYLRPGGRIVFIVFPQAFYVAVLAKIIGRLRRCRVDIHLDFRTVPLVYGRSRFRAWCKYFTEYALFWTVPIFLSRFLVTSFSFITKRMSARVGARGRPYCIWTSGVREALIAQSFPITPSRPGAPFELLYLGSMSLHRGVEEVVRAVAGAKTQLGPFVFRILGGGPGADTVRRIVAEMKAEDTIVMQDTVAPEAVPARLAKAHAFISPLPDHPWWRVSSPIKLFEYLATGKPLILTDTTPHRDVVAKGVRGIVWLPDLSPESIVAGLRDMMENYDEYLAAGYEDRLNVAREHTWRVQAQRLRGFLKDLYHSD